MNINSTCFTSIGGFVGEESLETNTFIFTSTIQKVVTNLKIQY